MYNQTSTRPLANYFDGRSLSIESPLAQERFCLLLLLATVSAVAFYTGTGGVGSSEKETDKGVVCHIAGNL